MPNNGQVEPVTPTEQNFARTPQELLQWNIINAHLLANNELARITEDINSSGMCHPDVFNALVRRLFNFIRAQIANKDEELVRKIDALVNIYTVHGHRKNKWPHFYNDTITAFNLINKHLYDVKLTKFDSKKEVDRSRIWKANKEDLSISIPHPWWLNDSPKQ